MARALEATKAPLSLAHALQLLPNALAPVLVSATIDVASAILTESALSFLGFGVGVDTVSWGSMLNSAQRFIAQAPWMAFWPGFAIFLAVLSFNLLGDGLRDALDPRQR